MFRSGCVALVSELRSAPQSFDVTVLTPGATRSPGRHEKLNSGRRRSSARRRARHASSLVRLAENSTCSHVQKVAQRRRQGPWTGVGISAALSSCCTGNITERLALRLTPSGSRPSAGASYQSRHSVQEGPRKKETLI